MKTGLVEISVRVPAELIEGLSRAAFNAGRTRDRQLAHVLRKYLLSDDKALTLGPLPRSLLDLSEEGRELIDLHAQIVQEWRRECDLAKSRGKTKRQVTEDLIARAMVYQGLKVSRPALYFWSKRLQAGGLVALADRRRIRRAAKGGVA